MRPRIVPLLLVLAWPAAAAAQRTAPLSEQDAADSVAIAAHARALVADATTDSERAAILYEWTARNVGYDVPRYLRGDNDFQAAEEVWRGRVAVCAGYVALYERMAHEVGLVAVPIRGYAKGFDYVQGVSTRRPNHAWLAVRLDDEWRFVDPTWGSGVVVGTRYEPRFTWDYFNVDPEALIISHFPRDSQWQLLQRPISRREFERMTTVPRTLFNIGFAPRALRAAALAGVRDFPLVDDAVPGFRVIDAPVVGTIRSASAVSVELFWPDAVEVAFVTPAGIYTTFRQNGDHFVGETVASDATILIVGRTDDAPAFRTLMQYRVQ